MTSRYPFPKRFPQLAKSSLLLVDNRTIRENRLWAKVIDVSIILFLAWFAGWVSTWIELMIPAILFTAFDGLGRGQSPGKWLMGLFTIELSRGERINLYQSFVRNIPFILLVTGVLLSSSPVLRFLMVTPALAMLGLETYFAMAIKGGVRVGDIVSNTRVFEYKDEHTLFIEQFLKADDA